MSHPIIGQGDHLVYQISQKNINLVEYVVILLPIKFHWILLCGFRGEFKNILANQRPWRPSCFSDLPEKHKLGGGHWDLASCQVSLNSVQRFKRRSQKCLSKLEAGAAILFFWSAWKTLGRGCWDLASCQVSLNPVQQFQRRKKTQTWKRSNIEVEILLPVSAKQRPGQTVTTILPFWWTRKTQNLVEDIRILLPVKFCWIPLRGFRRWVENVSAN